MRLDEQALRKEVGRRLRDCRQRQHLSQTEVASFAGILRTSLANIESGRQRLPLPVLYKLAVALDTDVCTLLPPAEEMATSDDVVPIEIDGHVRHVTRRTAAVLKLARGEVDGVYQAGRTGSGEASPDDVVHGSR